MFVLPRIYIVFIISVFSRQSLIYRREFTTDGEQASDFLHDYDLGTALVPYSLDKKRRWEFPNDLRMSLELEKMYDNTLTFIRLDTL